MMPLHSKPHLILYNSRIFDPASGRALAASALAVGSNRILALGSDADILSLAGPETERIDAGRRWLLPALTDAHTHLSGYATRKLQIDFTRCATIDEALAAIRTAVEATPPGRWITGGGWSKAGLGLSDFPDKRMLDEISTHHFLAFQSRDWHSVWVNSPVLDMHDIDETTADPPGGWILRYPDRREPSGVLQEKACEQILQSIAPPSFKEIYPALLENFREFHRLGITTAHSVETPYDFAHYQQLYDQGELGLRIFWYFPDKYLKESEAKGYHAGLGNHFLKICGVKMFSDGALGSQTADMLTNYRGLNHAGVEVLSAEALREKIALSVAQKLSCAIHAIGDRANRKVLQAFGEVADTSRRLDLRHRVEHAQLLHPDDIALFAQQSVIASMQPIHLAGDIPLIEQYWGERGRYAYAFNSLLNSGARLIFGSDTPIESFDPWKGIYSALTRKLNCDPAAPGFYPQERIELVPALQAYTLNCAYAVHEENHLGSIAVGKKADIILIDRDIFHEPPEALLENRVLLTLQGGKVLWREMG